MNETPFTTCRTKNLLPKFGFYNPTFFPTNLEFRLIAAELFRPFGFTAVSLVVDNASLGKTTHCCCCYRCGCCCYCCRTIRCQQKSSPLRQRSLYGSKIKSASCLKTFFVDILSFGFNKKLFWHQFCF